VPLERSQCAAIVAATSTLLPSCATIPVWVAQPSAHVLAALSSQACAVAAYLWATPFTGCAPQ